ncbi:MAG TPA: hypothetical protein PLZ12_14515 [Saprospiraceae bacterium]|nr:hypothetical protein [Saprospiraceae bacterium]
MEKFTHVLLWATASIFSPLQLKIMKKLYSICLFLVVCTALGAQAPGSWTALGSGITAAPRDFLGIDAVSADVAWGLAEHPTFAVGAREFCRTVDGGATWQTGVIDAANGGAFTSLAIYALDAETAWVIMTNVPTQNRGKIYKTTNGGQTWQEQTGSFNNIGSAIAFIHFFDADNGLAIGSPGTGNPATDSLRIWKTSNGGDIWNRIPPEQLPTPLASEGFWITSGNGHYAAVGNKIWFGTRRGRIWYSPDKGENWQVFALSSQNITNMSFSITFSDEQNGIAAGYGIAFRTNDGGQTWTPLTSLPASIVYYRVQYVPGANGVCYLTYEGSQSFFNQYRHAYSLNNGDTWTLIADQPRLLPFEFVSPTVGWGGGDIDGPDGKGMYRWSGNFGPASALQAPETAFSPRVFPNPFHNQMLLEFDIEDNSLPLNITVSDLFGRTIQTFQFSRLHPGLNQLPLQVEAPPGMLLLTLRQGGRVQTVKVVRE